MTTRAGRILGVDDDEGIRELIAMALSDEGYTVQLACHGAEALALVEQDPPDLILLDMRMPVMDGWEFAWALREIRGTQVPIVALTAGCDGANLADQIAAAGLVAKPFELDHLLDVVARLMSRDS